MRKAKQLTALQGVASAGFINIVSRGIGYLKHIAVTAFIGLSAELDAFYIAFSMIHIFITPFAGIFDFVGIPRLVKRLKEGGERDFLNMSGTIFGFTVRFSLVLTALLILFSPLSPFVAPGFIVTKKKFIYYNLYLLIPLALVFLPYHAFGAFLRARRMFHLFYMGELIIASISLVIILAYHRSELIIPVAFSAGFLGAFLFFFTVGSGPNVIKPKNYLQEEVNHIKKINVKIIPIYFTGYLFVIVDRFFASFLDTGSISALFYAFTLAVAVPALLNVESIFITPLAEAGERGDPLTTILSGVILLSIPVLAFTAIYSRDIVMLLFQRGAFTPHSTEITSRALTWYAIGIPAFFTRPILGRLFLMEERIKTTVLIWFPGVVINALLNYFLTMHYAFGVSGIAFATSASNFFICACALSASSSIGIRIRWKKLLPIIPVAIGATAVSAFAAKYIPLDTGSWTGMITIGSVFVLMYICIVVAFPNRELREIRGIIAESFMMRRKI